MPYEYPDTYIYTHTFFFFKWRFTLHFTKVCPKLTPRLDCLFTPPLPAPDSAAVWPLLTLLTLPLSKYRERTWKSYYVTGFLYAGGIVDFTRNKIDIIWIITYSLTFISMCRYVNSTYIFRCVRVNYQRKLWTHPLKTKPNAPTAVTCLFPDVYLADGMLKSLNRFCFLA